MAANVTYCHLYREGLLSNITRMKEVKKNICLIGLSCSGKTTLAARLCDKLDMGHVTISAATNEFTKSDSSNLEIVGNDIMLSGLDDPDIAWAVKEVIDAGITEPESFIQALFKKRTTYPDILVDASLRYKLQQMIQSGELSIGAIVDNIMSMKHYNLTSSVLCDETGLPFTDCFYLDANKETVHARARNNINQNPERYNEKRIASGIDFFNKITMPMIKELGERVIWLDANQDKEKVMKDCIKFLD